jgi:hypothetical protein
MPLQGGNTLRTKVIRPAARGELGGEEVAGLSVTVRRPKVNPSCRASLSWRGNR